MAVGSIKSPRGAICRTRDPGPGTGDPERAAQSSRLWVAL
jgi:hypothetical protein